MVNGPKHAGKAIKAFVMLNKRDIFRWPSQLSDLNPTGHAFQLFNMKLNAERHTNKQ